MTAVQQCERCAAVVPAPAIRLLCPSCYRVLHQAATRSAPLPLRPERLLDTTEAAALLGLRPDTVRRLVRAGRLPAYTITAACRPNGRRFRFRRAELLALLARHDPTGQAGTG